MVIQTTQQFEKKWEGEYFVDVFSFSHSSLGKSASPGQADYLSISETRGVWKGFTDATPIVKIFFYVLGSVKENADCCGRQFYTVLGANGLIFSRNSGRLFYFAYKSKTRQCNLLQTFFMLLWQTKHPPPIKSSCSYTKTQDH